MYLKTHSIALVWKVVFNYVFAIADEIVAEFDHVLSYYVLVLEVMHYQSNATSDLRLLTGLKMKWDKLQRHPARWSPPGWQVTCHSAMDYELKMHKGL